MVGFWFRINLVSNEGERRWLAGLVPQRGRPMPIFAGLTSVSKGHAPELWHFSCVCLDSSQALLPIKGHENIRCLKDKQVVKEEAGGTNKQSVCFMKRPSNSFSHFHISWVAFRVLMNIKDRIFACDLRPDSKKSPQTHVCLRFNNEYLNLG